MPFYNPSNTAPRTYGTIRVGGSVDFGAAPATINVDLTAGLVGLPGIYTLFEAAGGFIRDTGGGPLPVPPGTDISGYLLVTVPPGFSILAGPVVDGTGTKVTVQVGP